MNGVTSYRGTTFSERMAAAPCREADPELGYTGGEGKRGKSADAAHLAAKAVCNRCPFEIKQECLDLAMKAEGGASAAMRHGVYGGLDPEQRHRLSKVRVTA